MRVIFIGTGEIGVPTLRALLNSEHKLVGVVTQPDKPVGREQKIEPPPIKRALGGNGGLETAAGSSAVGKLPFLEILQPARIKDRQAIEAIAALQPDAIIVMAYGQILPRPILEIPRITCLNLHASLLPRWRGAAPIQAAIAAGDRETGITVMYMDEGLDTGDILLQRKIDIAPDDTGGTLHDRLAQIAPSALLESLALLASANAPRVSQDKSLATYAPKLKRENGKIDWTEPAEVIERKIRAYNPWPGAFGMLTDKSGRQIKLKIIRAELVEARGKSGAILWADNRGLAIAAGENALSLHKVQLEGKWQMSANDFVRGHARLLERKLK
jgi:methionyl-tRNA formyltransferase